MELDPGKEVLLRLEAEVLLRLEAEVPGPVEEVLPQGRGGVASGW